jgi:FMN phosphatase YigB (HAD superfamily)
VQPEECIFVDDQERHVEGAKDAGMTGLVFTDVPQIRTALDALLANPE